jgi:hypothetical protein
MSRGSWKAETRERRQSKEAALPPVKESDPGHIIELVHWQDRRVEARARAKEQTDAARQEAIAALAHRSRQEAKERGAKRYIGAPCERHADAERYTATGHCVFCADERKAARRGKPHTYGKVRGGKTPALRPYMRHVPHPRRANGMFGAARRPAASLAEPARYGVSYGDGERTTELPRDFAKKKSTH